MGQEVQQSTSTELSSKPGGFDLHTPSSSAEKTWTYGLSMDDDGGVCCCYHTTTSPKMTGLVNLSIGNLVFQCVQGPNWTIYRGVWMFNLQIYIF